MGMESCGKRPALVSPLEWFGHGAVVVLDESQDLALQVIDRSEVASFENFARKDTEPYFDLVHPGSMFGCVVKNNAMGRVAQESSPRHLGFQDTRFALHAQVHINI